MGVFTVEERVEVLLTALFNASLNMISFFVDTILLFVSLNMEIVCCVLGVLVVFGRRDRMSE